MARSPRITNPGEPTVYHLMSRTTLIGFPLGDAEKDYLVDLIRRFSRIYFVNVLGFCCMGNHFHLLVRMLPAEGYSNHAIKKRFKFCYGRHRKLLDGQIPYYRERWANISKFMRDIKVTFTRYYNRLHDHQGYFWGDRFKSVIVEDGNALINCLAYIDLNPVRAGLVERPEDYRWSGIGWHVQTKNTGGFLSTDFGLEDHHTLSAREKLREYRKFLYGVGALEREKGAKLKPELIEEEAQNDFELSRLNRFCYRTKYFTDSGIIGSRRFISQICLLVRHRMPWKKARKPHEIDGLNGIYSLKKFIDREV